ncbi:hypothetical protein [Veronia pacifica]|nr:hypothetical protein [Veronia pacifica]
MAKKILKSPGFGMLSTVIFLFSVGVFTSINSVDGDVVFEPYIAQAAQKIKKGSQSPLSTSLLRKKLKKP